MSLENLEADTAEKERKIRFQHTQHKDFLPLLRKRILQEFRDSKQSYHANAELYLKTVLLVLLYLATYAAIMSDGFQGFALIGFFALLGIIKTLIGFNIVHDALHGAYSSNPRINRFLGYYFDLNGTSSHVWIVSHNGEHHIYTNIPGVDQDIEKAIILRFSPQDKLYKFHYFQNWYAPFLYCFTSVYWTFVSDYLWFAKECKKGTLKLSEKVLFLSLKAINLLLFFILPMVYLSAPIWQVALGGLAMHMASSAFMSFIFQLAHLVEYVRFPTPDAEGKIAHDWGLHELVTTCNFATHNRFLSFFLGGLNFQIEHHLFPYISHVHYPKISKIVKMTAQEFGIPYNEAPTLWEAIKSHFRTLKQLGREEGYKKET